MKKYRVTVKRLNVRKYQSATAAAIDTLSIGAEFLSPSEVLINGGQLWAERSSGGWLCVHDKLQRFCEEVPMPAEAPDAGPNHSWPAPETSLLLAEIDALKKSVAELERKVEILGTFVAAHKND